jgi:hypothetical protein
MYMSISQNDKLINLNLLNLTMICNSAKHSHIDD